MCLRVIASAAKPRPAQAFQYRYSHDKQKLRREVRFVICLAPRLPGRQRSRRTNQAKASLRLPNGLHTPVH